MKKNMKLKRIVLLLLAATLIFSMCGCGGAQEDVQLDSEPSSSASAAEPESSLTPTPDPKTTPEYHCTDEIRDREVLTVGMCSKSKTCYIIPNDPEKYGELANTRGGYVPEMCRKIAEVLGVEVEFVEIGTLEAQLQAVADGDVDMVADNFTITDERLALYEMTIDFSVTEIEGDVVFLSTTPQPWLPQKKQENAEEPGSDPEPGEEPSPEPEPREMIKNEEELAHARIAVIKGSVQARNTTMQYPEAELYELADNEAILQALIEGEVDAGVFTMMNREFADKIVESILDGTVAQSSYQVITPDFRGYGLILMKGNDDLRETLNEIISDLMESGWLKDCFAAEEIKAAERGIA